MCSMTHSQVSLYKSTSQNPREPLEFSVMCSHVCHDSFIFLPWLIHKCLYLLIHRSQSPNPDTQIPRYKFKSNQNLTLNFYDEIPRNLSYSISSCIFRILDFEDVAFSEEIVITHKKLLGISGCRTRPLKTSGYQPRLTQVGTIEKCTLVWS